MRDGVCICVWFSGATKCRARVFNKSNLFPIVRVHCDGAIGASGDHVFESRWDVDKTPV